MSTKKKSGALDGTAPSATGSTWMDSKKKNPHKQGQITEEMQKTLEHQLRDGEYVLAQFKPERAALKRCAILGASSVPLPFVILWMVIAIGVIGGITVGIMSDDAGGPGLEILFFMIPFFAIWLFPVWMWIGGIVLAKRRYPYIHYAITNMRFLCRQRRMDMRFRTVPYEQIRRIWVRNKAFGKFQKIIIETHGIQKYYINGLSNGHEIYDMLDRALHEFREMNPHLLGGGFGRFGFGGGFGGGGNFGGGAPMQRATHCTGCGSSIGTGNRGFCGHCGTKLQTWQNR